MKFNELQFKNTDAQRVYHQYIKRIRNTVKPIPEADGQEVLMEFNSHIHEYLQKYPDQPELNSLLNIIDKLGAPEEVLKPLIADKLLEKATRTFNPLHLFKALVLNITNGISYTIFAILYLFLGSFAFLIFAKAFTTDVGMYFKEGKFQAVGWIKNPDGHEEVLGHWFIPLVVFAIILIYLLLTLLLKLKKSFINTKLS